jgi:hypothetical protein
MSDFSAALIREYALTVFQMLKKKKNLDLFSKYETEFEQEIRQSRISSGDVGMSSGMSSGGRISSGGWWCRNYFC